MLNRKAMIILLIVLNMFIILINMFQNQNLLEQMEKLN